jgi:hypothetical protein
MMRQIRRATTEFDVAMRQLDQALDTAKTLEADLHALDRNPSLQVSGNSNKRSVQRRAAASGETGQIQLICPVAGFHLGSTISRGKMLRRGANFSVESR